MKNQKINRRCEVSSMQKIIHGIAFGILASVTSAVALATGTQWTSTPMTISSIEVVGDAGGFVVYLNGFDDPNCSSNPTGIYVYPNSPSSQAVSQAGVNEMLAEVLAARATGAPVNILYNDASDHCFGIYITY